MTEHTPLRAAAISEAARVAGAIDPSDVVTLIDGAETMAPADAVAALRSLKPHLFHPKQAKDMTPSEYDASLRKLGVHPKSIRRNS